MRFAFVLTVVTLVLGAAQAQGATVYQYCQDFWGCDPHFVAANGERNNLTVTQADPEPTPSVRFEDAAGLVIIHPARADYAVPGFYGRSLTETLLACEFAVKSATCGTQFGPEIYLGNGDDVARVEYAPVIAPVDCGPGFDTVYTVDPGNADNCETVIQL